MEAATTPPKPNDEILTLAMIETAGGLENLDAILKVEGLDGIYIGPADLSLCLWVCRAASTRSIRRPLPRWIRSWRSAKPRGFAAASTPDRSNTRVIWSRKAMTS